MTSGLETGVTGFSGTFKWSWGLDIIGRLFLSYMALIDRLLVRNRWSINCVLVELPCLSLPFQSSMARHHSPDQFLHRVDTRMKRKNCCNIRVASKSNRCWSKSPKLAITVFQSKRLQIQFLWNSPFFSTSPSTLFNRSTTALLDRSRFATWS